MKKLITILAITSLFSFQAFAQESLSSGACNTPDSTCQAFELGINGEILKDFSVSVTKEPSFGKVRRGEYVEVEEVNMLK